MLPCPFTCGAGAGNEQSMQAHILEHNARHKIKQCSVHLVKTATPMNEAQRGDLWTRIVGAVGAGWGESR